MCNFSSLYPKLNSENYLLYAAKGYKIHPSIMMSDFEIDMKQFSILQRYLMMYKNDKQINLMSIVNQTKFLNMSFKEIFPRLAFYMVSKETHSQLKTVLFYLDILPEEIKEVKLNRLSLDKNLLSGLINLG